MRLTKLFFRTLKEHPEEAEVISHQLLERGGYLKKLGKGLYSHTPLMARVLKRIATIIREELDKAGCQEIVMPILHPAELWQKTGRWDDFKSANLLYTLTDREQRDYCIAPTHEEVVVSLVSGWVSSYRQLPFNLYQIATKFRDEIRPRFGLMRSKEFLMKDGYSFSSNEMAMEEEYQKMRVAYSNIFKRLGLDFVIVSAHSGKIGKGKSEEFQVKASIGEDAIMVAPNDASNIEQTVSIAPQYTYDKELKPMTEIQTPHTSSIEDLAQLTKRKPYEILKTILYKLIFNNREEFVAIGVRGDREVNDVKVCDYFGAIEIALASEEEVLKATGCRPGFAGPLNCKLPFYADKTVEPMTNFVTAANKPDIHFLNVNFERDVAKPVFHDFLLAKEGDASRFGGTYKVERGIEVGHIFNLGTLYTEKLAALFQDEGGQIKPIWMGTYGIGVGRCASACIEQNHDEKGILWPLAIAPFTLFMTAATTNNAEQVKAADEIYEELKEFDILYDDRDERLGLKLKDSDLIGIPFKLIVGKTLAEGKVEIETRKGEKQLIERSGLKQWAKDHLVR